MLQKISISKKKKKSMKENGLFIKKKKVSQKTFTMSTKKY